MAGRIHMEPMNRPMHTWVYPKSLSTFDLNAPYQRGSVWDDTQRRNLVRSILWGIPIGSIIIARQPLDADKYHRVVDGKQRIETIVSFMADGFTVPRCWFDSSSPMGDDGPQVVWSELTALEQAWWLRTTVQTLEFDPEMERTEDPETGSASVRRRSPAEILAFEAMVYELINTGGVPHSDDDLTAARSLSGKD